MLLVTGPDGTRSWRFDEAVDFETGEAGTVLVTLDPSTGDRLRTNMDKPSDRREAERIRTTIVSWRRRCEQGTDDS